jgi:hypothetical protein
VTPRSTLAGLAAALLLTAGCSPSGQAAAPGQSPSAGTGAGTGIAAAEAIVTTRTGYGHCDPNGWVEGDTFQVLTCVAPGAATPPEFAFFFAGGVYLGTDTKDPSAQVRFVSRTADTVTLAYSLFRFGDPACCPTGGSASVRYRWDGSAVTPLDPMPPETATASAPGREP